MVTSSTTGTSSTACGANQWRCLTWCIATALFPRPAYRLAWEKLLAGGDAGNAVLASQWWRSWRWRMTEAAKPNSMPSHSPEQMTVREAEAATVSIDVPPALQARFAPVCRQRCPTSSSPFHRLPRYETCLLSLGAGGMNDGTSDTIKVDSLPRELPLLLRDLRTADNLPPCGRASPERD